MGDRTFTAYFLATAASAFTIDLVFLLWSGDFGDLWTPDAVFAAPVVWLFTCLMTLIGSLVPAAAMVGVSQHYQIRSPWFFILWSCGGALILAFIVSGMAWSPAFPPDDPNYPSFDREFGRISLLFECAALVGGLAYWAALRWLSWKGVPPNTAPPAS